MHNVFLKHQIAIARRTLNMTEQMALIMGGMTIEQAKKILTENGEMKIEEKSIDGKN